VLSSEAATARLIGRDISTVVGLCNRAIIAVMTYTFAGVGTVVALSVEDDYPQKKRWWLRLREKNGKVNEMPATTSWKNIWMPTSGRRASQTTARGRCSAPRSGRRRNSARGRCHARMPGTWCAAALRMRKLKARQAAHLPRNRNYRLPDERRHIEAA
jgi:hypothetical protein